MDIQLEVIDSKLHIQFVGNLNETNAIALADRMLNLCPAQIPAQVLLDFSKCHNVCVQGLGAIVSFRLAPQICKSATTITGQSESLERQMRNLKLDRLFDFVFKPQTKSDGFSD